VIRAPDAHRHPIYVSGLRTLGPGDHRPRIVVGLRHRRSANRMVESLQRIVGIHDHDPRRDPAGDFEIL